MGNYSIESLINTAPTWHKDPMAQTICLGLVFCCVFVAYTMFQFYAATKYGPLLASKLCFGNIWIVHHILRFDTNCYQLLWESPLDAKWDVLLRAIHSRIIVTVWLKGCCIISLELTSLVAGTKYWREFEERLQSILIDITNKNSPTSRFFSLTRFTVWSVPRVPRVASTR